MSRYSAARLGLLVTALVAGGFGCELIAQIDRSKIDGVGGNGGGASATSTSTSTSSSAVSSSSSGGAGGTGGTGGAGGTTGSTGGAGGAMPCATASECPDPGNECLDRTCAAGQCGQAPKSMGTPGATQTTGDCQKVQCDGAGKLVSVADDADLPVDAFDCTSDICTLGVPTNPAKPASTACGLNGDLFCDGAGKCAACLIATDCAGVDTECQQRSCVAGVCGVTNSPAGTALSTQTASDCKKVVCDGNGAATSQIDDTDLPNDSNVCTTDVCTSGVPSHASAMNGLSCGGTLACLNGACTGCGQPSDCPGVDDECKARTCTVGVCGFNFTATGTAVAAQTAGDCQKKQCDGAGNIASVTDNTDAPADDGNQCTGDVCVAGAPSHPAAAANTACTQTGGSFCSAVGTCVQCNAATQCAGTDTACHTRTCAANTCGANNAAVGTVTSAQATGDCHKNQCDGAGNIVNNIDNTDLPVDDGNQCTGEICTAGAASHPAAALNTACNQAGGSFCSAGGTCVGCNAAAQCAGTDTDCQTRTCAAGACGFSFAASGTPTSTQAAGDCVENQCNGAGGVLIATKSSDVPADDGLQCTSETCVGSTPSHPGVAAGTACNQGGGTACNGAGACVAATCNDGLMNGTETAIDCGGSCGKCALGLTCNGNTDCLSGACAGGVCVQCLVGAQCPGSDTECQVRTCNANVCGVSNTAAGTATAAQSTGDCHKNQCDGAGNIVNGVDNTDVPADDGNACTSDTCLAGVPSHPAAANGTACNDGDSCTQSDTCQAGACTGANPVTCAALDQCHSAGTCAPATGVCSNPPKADGSACSDGNGCTQTDTCQAGTCAGGNPVTCAALDQCHSAGTCAPATGVCSNPTQPINTACNQGGGSFCSATGTCVQCNAATQCAGTDTECHTRTCAGNTCGANDASFGTPTSAQTPADCQMNVCDGAGNIISAADNTDVPVDDGNQCTGEICTAGVASHPSSTAGTACNQSGGTTCDGAGTCVAVPQVASTSPSDATTPVAAPPVAVTFTIAMNPATLTGQTTAGACSGSIQVSLDNFASCVAFSSAAATMSGGNTTATFTTAPGLLVNRIYKIRVTTAATSATGNALAAQFTTPTGFTTTSPNLCQGTVVISQVFGGGGASAAVPNADYVELHNRGTTAVTMTSWSLQYASSAGTTWQVVSFTGTIQPSAYFLVRMQNVQATGTALPTIDASGAGVNMAQAAGKIALVSNTTALSGACPTSASIVDFLGYGAQVLATGCWEGPTATVSTASAPSATTADYRVQSGCADVNNNTSDFTTAAPAPRNSASAAVACTCAVQNESNAALEADFCTVQFPLSLNPAAAGATTAIVYGRIYEAGTTEAAGAPPNVRAQLGYGLPTVNPEYEAGWTWTNATYNAAFVDPSNDEYQASFTAPATGSYRYAYRFSLDQGVSWTVCDQNAGDGGAGANAGLLFAFADEPVLTVP